MSASLTWLLQVIQDAAVDADRWQAVQAIAGSYMGAIGTQLASVDHLRNNQFWSTSTVDGLDDWLADVGHQLEPVVYAQQNPDWRVIRDYDYISEHAMDRSPFYVEQERAFDIRYRLCLRLVDQPNVSKAVVFFLVSDARAC